MRIPRALPEARTWELIDISTCLAVRKAHMRHPTLLRLLCLVGARRRKLLRSQKAVRFRTRAGRPSSFRSRGPANKRLNHAIRALYASDFK